MEYHVLQTLGLSFKSIFSLKQMFQIKNGLNWIIELIFISVISLVSFTGKGVDAGEFIFLFVFENTLILVSFLAFVIIVWPIQRFLKGGVQLNQVVSFLLLFLKSIGGILVYGFIALILVLFLNQLTVELLVGYMQHSSFQSESIRILSENGLYLEESVTAKLAMHFGKSYGLVFWVIFLRYFIQQVLDFFIQKRNWDVDFTFNLLVPVSLKIILSPIFMFIACIILVVLHSFFGPQPVVLVVSLLTFRLLFNFVNQKLTTYFTNL